METSKLTRKSQNKAIHSNQHSTNYSITESVARCWPGRKYLCCLPYFHLPCQLAPLSYFCTTLSPHFSLHSCVFYHGASLEPFPHPGLLICGMINPRDKAFSCCCSQLHFFVVVLTLSVLPFLLISSETHRADDSKEAQKKGRNISEVIAQCTRKLKLQHL